jgi:hypothetical protein
MSAGLDTDVSCAVFAKTLTIARRVRTALWSNRVAQRAIVLRTRAPAETVSAVPASRSPDR